MQEFWELQGLLVNNRLMHEGFSGFIKQFGSLIKPINVYKLQKDSIQGSLILTQWY